MLDFNQMLRTRVAYQSDSDAIPVARVEGITSAAIFMGGGVITGDVPLMNLDGWTWEENMVRPIDRPRDELPGRRGWRTRRRRRCGGRGGGAGGGARCRSSTSCCTQARAYGANAEPPMDWNLEPLVPIVQKKQPIFVQAGTEQAIRDAIAWAERQGINIVIRTHRGAAVADGRPAQGEERARHSQQRADDAAGRGHVPRRQLSGGGRARRRPASCSRSRAAATTTCG